MLVLWRLVLGGCLVLIGHVPGGGRRPSDRSVGKGVICSSSAECGSGRSRHSEPARVRPERSGLGTTARPLASRGPPPFASAQPPSAPARCQAPPPGSSPADAGRSSRARRGVADGETRGRGEGTGPPASCWRCAPARPVLHRKEPCTGSGAGLLTKAEREGSHRRTRSTRRRRELMNRRSGARRARCFLCLVRLLHLPQLVGPQTCPTPMLLRENNRGAESESTKLLPLLGCRLRKSPRLERDLVPLEIFGSRVAQVARLPRSVLHPHLNARSHHSSLSLVVHDHRPTLTRGRSSIEGPRLLAHTR